MKAIKKILFTYSLVLTLSLFYQGTRQMKSLADLILILLVTAPMLYFLFEIIIKLSKFDKLIKNDLLKIARSLKAVSLITTFVLFLTALFGLIFRFEFIFLVMIFPLPLYFWLISFHQQREKTTVETKPAEKTKEEMISEPLRRKFIKMIGGTGVGLLIAALISPKKAEAAFFGSVPGPGTVAVKDSSNNKIDPAIKSPTDAYGITQIDDSSPSYYGFVNKEGSWYITRETDDGAYRYSKGAIDFSSNWLNRDSLSYGYFDTTF